MAKRKKYTCEVFPLNNGKAAAVRDANAEAAILRKAGYKATVKVAGNVVRVCRKFRRKR